MSNYYQSRGMGLSEPSGNRPGNSFSLGGGLYSNTHSQNPMHNPENSRNNTGESEMKNWQDGLKRLLPNVNIRFSDNLSQNQQTPHLNGYSNRSNQQNDIFRQFQTSNIQRGKDSHQGFTKYSLERSTFFVVFLVCPYRLIGGKFRPYTTKNTDVQNLNKN